MSVFALGLVAGGARADPTEIGPTGGAFLPTASVLADNEYIIAGDYYNTVDNTTWPMRLSFGVTPRLEIGASLTGNSTSVVWGLNGKYACSLFDRPGFAVGGLYRNARDINLRASQVYLVYTHPFSRPGAGALMRATGGVNWTLINFPELGHEQKVRFFGSIDATFRQRLSIGGEIQSASFGLGEDHPLTSVWARYAVTEHLAAQVGLSNADPLGVLSTDHHRLFAGLSYSFGPGEPFDLIPSDPRVAEVRGGPYEPRPRGAGGSF